MDSLPPWPVVQSMLLSVVLPGFAAGAGLLAVACAVTPSATGRLIGAALALVGGLAAGNLACDLLPWWSLELGWPSLIPATLVTLAGGVLATAVSASHGSRWGLGLRLLTAAGCAWWLTPAAPTTPGSRLGFFLLLFGGCALQWEAFRRIGHRSDCTRAALAFVIPWGAGAATVLIYGALARFCDMAVLLTATFAGVGLVAFLRKLNVAEILAGPAIYFPALMLGGAANTFSEVPMASFILIALAPCALWSLFLPPMRHWSGRALVLAAVIAIAIPCAAGVVLAMRAESLDFGG